MARAACSLKAKPDVLRISRMRDPKHSKSASAHLRALARQLRKNCTIPERLLWGLLRDRRLAGAKFRRQHCVGPYIVDFYAPAHQLIVELDGRSHDDRGLSDRQRQDYLESVVGLRVMRVGNDDVLNDPESVIFGLMKALGVPID
jgi:adenine-specific DNA-methyltransferase